MSYIIPYLVAFFIFLLFRKWTKAKSNLGINLKRVYCPTCNTKQPIIRKPLNQRQVLYGGWTCRNCNTEMDKYGRIVSGDELSDINLFNKSKSRMDYLQLLKLAKIKLSDEHKNVTQEIELRISSGSTGGEIEVLVAEYLDKLRFYDHPAYSKLKNEIDTYLSQFD